MINNQSIPNSNHKIKIPLEKEALTFSASIGLLSLVEYKLLKSFLCTIGWPIICEILSRHTSPIRIQKKDILHRRVQLLTITRNTKS